MTSMISFVLLSAATLLTIAAAFPAEKLQFNGPPPLKSPGPHALLERGPPKGLVPRIERSAPVKDLKTSESYGFGYGGWGGHSGWGWGGHSGWGWGGWGDYWGWGYPSSYSYWGHYPYWGGYGGYPYGSHYGSYYGGWYPWGNDWWWWW